MFRLFEMSKLYLFSDLHPFQRFPKRFERLGTLDGCYKPLKICALLLVEFQENDSVAKSIDMQKNNTHGLVSMGLFIFI